MIWLHWSLELPSAKWQQSCIPHIHKQNDSSWQGKCQISFFFSLVGPSLPVSLHGSEEVQPVLTSSLPKIHSPWISSQFAILKSKYSLKKNFPDHLYLPRLRVHEWASPYDPAPREDELWVCCGCIWVLILNDTHHTRMVNLGGGGVMGKKEILLWIC